MEKSYYQGTLEMIENANRKQEIMDKWEAECIRLLRSGAIDREDHNRGLLFGVALENVADGWLCGERTTKAYKNLKHF